MIEGGTFKVLSEVATKPYKKDAKMELEWQLNDLAKESSTELIKRLNLPNILIFLASTIARSYQHQIITQSDVKEASAFLRYLLSRDRLEKLIENDTINIGLPENRLTNKRLDVLAQIKYSIKIQNHLEAKINRLKNFLTNQNLHSKHVKRIIDEIKAIILLLSFLMVSTRPKSKRKLTVEEINISYDITRYFIFKLKPIRIKILTEIYSINNSKIWKKIPQVTFEQSTHDHLSNTAYASWENELPESFEALAKHIGCSNRPFIAAIFAYCEIYAGKHNLTRIGSNNLMYILEEFEDYIFEIQSPMIIEESGSEIKFTKEGVELLSDIARWIKTIIVTNFGKDEYVFNFSSTVPRQLSLIFLIALVEKVNHSQERIGEKQLATALIKWSNLIKSLIKNSD
ncbi:MAG: hypothetical protein GF308_14300 [Candidatus Heimdallarchaeota archaeon]|nr:hypothetical protein [Candidatus Heimdallarchaeota archaeon]